MANQYSQIFTLKDIFNNKKLEKKLPLVNYKEVVTKDGRTAQRTNITTIRKRVFDTATSVAKAYYSPLVAQRLENQLILDGNMTGDQDEAVNEIYTALKGIRSVLIWTANNANMVRYALKEAEKNKRNFGIDSRLYLRVQSMQEIEGMSRSQLQALLENVMENIVYGDNFPETQKKFAVDKLVGGGKYSYEDRVFNWKRKVGAL